MGIGWQVASQIAGVLGFFLGGGSLILGVKNYQQNVKNYEHSQKALEQTLTAPEREERRKHRNELRDLLLKARDDVKTGKAKIDNLSDIDKEVPTSFKELKEAIPRLQGLLKTPDTAELESVRLTASSCTSGWSLLSDRIYKYAATDPQGRERMKTERTMSNRFGKAIETFDAVLATIADLNERGM